MFSLSPDAALTLLAAGALCVCWEFIRPGLVIPGVTGCLLVAFGIRELSHYPVSAGAAGLMLFAFVFFAVEARVRVRGVSAATGALTLFAGALKLVPAGQGTPGIHWQTALAVTLPFSAIVSFFLTMARRAWINKRVRIF